MREHQGAHPCIGALDVCPLVYLRADDRGLADRSALDAAERIAAELEVPVFLYGELATASDRRERAFFRRGGLPELTRRMQSGELEAGLWPGTSRTRPRERRSHQRPPAARRLPTPSGHPGVGGGKADRGGAARGRRRAARREGDRARARGRDPDLHQRPRSGRRPAEASRGRGGAARGAEWREPPRRPSWSASSRKRRSTAFRRSSSGSTRTSTRVLSSGASPNWTKFSSDGTDEGAPPAQASRDAGRQHRPRPPARAAPGPPGRRGQCARSGGRAKTNQPRQRQDRVPTWRSRDPARPARRGCLLPVDADRVRPASARGARARPLHARLLRAVRLLLRSLLLPPSPAPEAEGTRAGNPGPSRSPARGAPRADRSRSSESASRTSRSSAIVRSPNRSAHSRSMSSKIRSAASSSVPSALS